ncbi:aromatic prenyltransferase [Streptomyces sp. NBC_00457]|uniref:aromatic prenyltransferase n=1 Tax=unclassified Streptomyces TaxID=2593676 RepID=UPI002E236330|nr:MULTISPECIES: aromatic prenyltransferase [unclassified Streptomyces]
MSAVTVVDEVYSAIEESARLVGAACSREKVVPILTAYFPDGEALAQAGVALTVQTGERHAGELDYTINVPAEVGDPYALALAKGFVAETGHPVGALLSEVQQRCPVNEFMIDCGVAGGFKKIYAHFPHDLQAVSKLADIPSMPPAVAGNLGFFARHGLNDVAMIAFDYRRNTINLYFTRLSDECRGPQNILSMLRETGLPDPDERMLEFARGAFRVNVTLGWDSSRIVRFCFAPPPARGVDPSTLPVHVEPGIQKFAKNAPYTYPGGRVNLLGVKWTPDGECLDVASYYQLSPLHRKVLSAIHKQEF